jgi:hypothetical protein
MRIKKAQTAMEFLMTYGWAILIVIAVVAALYAMGVFKLPGRGLGKCSPCFPAGSAIAYVDHNSDTLVIRVGPSEITDVSALVGTTWTSEAAGEPFAAGATASITGVGLFTGDTDVTVQYTDTTSNLSHNVTATLHGA